MADVFGTFRKSSPWRTFLELFGNQEWLPLSDVFETFRTSSPWWTFLELSRNQAWLPLGDVFRTFRKSSVAPLADIFETLRKSYPDGHFWNFPEIERGSPWRTFLELFWKTKPTRFKITNLLQNWTMFQKFYCIF